MYTLYSESRGEKGKEDVVLGVGGKAESPKLRLLCLRADDEIMPGWLQYSVVVVCTLGTSRGPSPLP